MCGRFVSSNTPEEIAGYFGALVDEESAEEPLPPSYNVAPTDQVYGVLGGSDGNAHLRAFRWGLVPSWAKDVKIGSKMINARAETLDQKPAFRQLLPKRRAIIPMDGFYEWQAVPGAKQKQPFFVRRRDRQPLAVAGLWSSWRDPAAAGSGGGGAEWLRSCTVITTEGNSTMAQIHDRMPVILPEDAWEQWLDRRNDDVDALRRLLVPAPDDLLELVPVSTEVNNVRNGGPQLIEPVSPAAAVHP